MASGKKNYFRHSVFARNDEFILEAIDKFGYKAYFYWFALLEICAEQAADEYPESFKFHQSRLYRELRCNKRSLKPVLDYFQTSMKLVYNKSENYYEIQIPNLAKYCGSYKKTETERVPNKKKEKEIKVKETKGTDSVCVFDFDEIYKSYPRKAGKKKGIDICKRHIKTEESFSQLKRAVENYGRICAEHGTDSKYIKHFSTFMNCWEDFVDIDEVPDLLDSMAIEEFRATVSTENIFERNGYDFQYTD